jgi:hypothetical protein
MTRDELVTRARTFLSNADKTDPNTSFVGEILMEMIHMETELTIAWDEARHQRERHQRLMRAVQEEIPAEKLPYRLYAMLDTLERVG